MLLSVNTEHHFENVCLVFYLACERSHISSRLGFRSAFVNVCKLCRQLSRGEAGEERKGLSGEVGDIFKMCTRLMF